MSMDPAIVAEFFAEGNEHLDALEACLLRLEGNPGDTDAIDRSFRAAHSIKGAAGFLGLGAVERLMHAAEDLLDLFRQGKAVIDGDSAGALFRAGDRCRMLLDAARNGEDVDVGSVEAMVVVLREAVARGTSGPAASPAVSVPVPVAAAAPSAAGGSVAERAPSSAPATSSPGGAVLVGRAPRVPRVVRRAPEAAALVAAAPAPAPAPPAPVVAPTVHVPVASAVPSVAPAATPAAAPVAALAPVAPAPPGAAPRPAAVSPAREAEAAEARDASTGTIRVDVSLLDDIMNLVGELVVARNRLVQVVGERDDRVLAGASRRVDHLTSDLQGRVMKTRMRPVAVAWGALPRLVRDVAASTGKFVNVEMHGQDTELDRSLLEVLKDPLAHMIRNCVDHGLETPDERVAAGKAPVGTISLRSRHSGGQVHIEVTDDGRGIQVERVRARAIANGLVTADEAAQMPEEALLALIFRPGFSTAETVSNLSGRGVGMDVVKSSVERVGGGVDIRSTPGKGTTIRLKLPLTLAIVPALITLVGARRFCVSQANLVEIVDLVTPEARARVEWLAGAPLYRLRGQLLPLVPLGTTLGMVSAESEVRGYVVVVESDDLRFGIVVDDIQHTEEIVVKPVGAEIKQAQVYSGATVLGDGSVALILDVVALGRRGRVAAFRAPDAAAAKQGDEEGELRTLLRLDVETLGTVAVDVDAVVRIDEARAVDVFMHGGVAVFRYQDRVVPLRRLCAEGAWNQIVVCASGSGLVGLAVTEVLDVVTQPVRLTRGLGAAWSLGVGFVQGQPTTLVDVARLEGGAS